ncbi:hypothetical protein QTI24_24540 [Variovorax sp. J22P240]|uniref:hypothetical protein n=1 Tax=Variovorax sp. J22P240 TaxID=3053514 RepID=UPI002575E87F|nr:hypothetical protein [Variovorax sp. J22P240]MDM0001799.1 hypothetical protein [Variovorax sp. J22P240]
MGATLFSPLYCRFNGFAFGAFLVAANLEFAGPRFGAMRRRLREFMREIEIDAVLPSQHLAYRAAHDANFESILRKARARSQLLYEFMGIGAMAVLYASSAKLVGPSQRQALRERWIPVLSRHAVPPSVYDRFLNDVERAAHTRDASVLLSHAFRLVSDLLEPLEGESDTCFVAMPFGAPFAGYFASYYRPALASAGFRAIRAWGGLSEEEYYSFLAPLINRCASVLAELGSLNPNVMNEVGLAHGTNRPTFLIMRAQRRPPPSNLADLPILEYSDQAAGWQAAAVPTLAKFIGWMWEHYVASVSDEDLVGHSARQLIRYLQVLERPVPRSLRVLAAKTKAARPGCP